MKKNMKMTLFSLSKELTTETAHVNESERSLSVNIYANLSHPVAALSMLIVVKCLSADKEKKECGSLG